MAGFRAVAVSVLSGDLGLLYATAQAGFHHLRLVARRCDLMEGITYELVTSTRSAVRWNDRAGFN